MTRYVISEAERLAGTQIWCAQKQEDREERWSEIERLSGRGYTPSQIADLMAVDQDSIARQARRWGRHELARMFDRKKADGSRT